MKVLVFGEQNSELQSLLDTHGFEITESNPEMVISYGGDGALLKSEHAHPQIPKLLLRNSKICKLCSPLPNELVLEKIAQGAYTVDEVWKIEGRFHDQTITALNDIVVHNADPRHAIRYHVWVNEKQVGDHVIGDGIVVANPLGSTGYYRSITHSFFEVGMGLAFNNSTETADHMILREDSSIRMSIIRGPAFLYADNQTERIQLADHNEVLIKKSDTSAHIVRV